MSTQLAARVQQKDLWQQAFDQLPADLQQTFNARKTAKLNILHSVVREAEKKQEDCRNRAWKLRSGGKVIIIRDVFEKIIHWVNRFKDIGDQAVSYDPAHAALPWAAVRFVLSTMVSYVEASAKLACNIEMVTEIIARYHHFERLHLHRGGHVSDNIEQALVRLYTNILAFLAHAIHKLDQSKIVKILKSPFATPDEHMAEIANRDAEVRKLADLDNTEIMTAFEKSIIRMVNASELYSTAVKDAEFRELVLWISETAYRQHHKSRSDERRKVTGTAEWLLKDDTYRQWIQSSSSEILLLHGIAGCGKTMLASRVIDEMGANAVNSTTAPKGVQNGSPPLAYFYCTTTASQTDLDATAIMRSIVRQLGVNEEDKKVDDSILNVYQQEQTRLDKVRLNLEQSTGLILKILKRTPATIVVDAIDELPVIFRESLVTQLNRIAAEANNVTKVFVTSRDDSTVFSLLDAFRHLRISPAMVSHDVAAFALQSVRDAGLKKKWPHACASVDFEEKLSSIMAARAGEMYVVRSISSDDADMSRFWWISLQLARLRQQVYTPEADETDILADAGRLGPDMLDHIYSEIFNVVAQAGDTVTSFTRKVFSWLLVAREPLSHEALAASLMSKEGSTWTTDDISRTCCHLVIHDKQLRAYRFAHTTVQEYLQTHTFIDVAAAHSIVAEVCVETCADGFDLSSFSLSSWVSPVPWLYPYGAVYWALHVQEAREADTNTMKTLDGLVQSFIWDDDGTASFAFTDWLSDIQMLAETLPIYHQQKGKLMAIASPSENPVFVACCFGLTTVFNRVASESGFDPDMENTSGHTCLYLASANGHHEIVAHLLHLGASTDTECGRLGSALHAACHNGFGEVVQLFLSHKANLNAGSRFDNAVLAALHGQQEAIALLLLQHKAPATQHETDKILEAAVSFGVDSVVEQLQRLQPPALQSPQKEKVRAVIDHGRTRVLENQLQKHGANILPDDAVATAAFRGHNEIVELCLDSGLDIEKEGPRGSPLRAASVAGHLETIELLLSKGADLHADGRFGDALQGAASVGQAAAVQLLIRHGAKGTSAKKPSGPYEFSLHAACAGGHAEVVQFLLERGALMNEAAFDAAALAGHLDVLELFVQRGYSPNPRLVPCAGTSEYGCVNALDDALMEGQVDAVRCLLQHRQQSLNDHGGYDTTRAFYQAIRMDSVAMTSAFLDEIPTAGRSDYWTALRECAEHRSWNVMDLILGFQWSETGEAYDICGLLFLACHGRRQVFESLWLYAREEPGLADSLFDAVLLQALEIANVDIVRFLLQDMPTSKHHMRSTIFKKLCQIGDPSLVLHVFEMSDDPINSTALVDGISFAAGEGHKKVIERIQEYTSSEFPNLIHPRSVIDAAAKGYLETVQMLDQGISKDTSGITYRRCAMIKAAAGCHWEVCEYLVNVGLDPNFTLEVGSRCLSPLTACLHPPEEFDAIDKVFSDWSPPGIKYPVLRVAAPEDMDRDEENDQDKRPTLWNLKAAVSVSDLHLPAFAMQGKETILTKPPTSAKREPYRPSRDLWPWPNETPTVPYQAQAVTKLLDMGLDPGLFQKGVDVMTVVATCSLETIQIVVRYCPLPDKLFGPGSVFSKALDRSQDVLPIVKILLLASPPHTPERKALHSILEMAASKFESYYPSGSYHTYGVDETREKIQSLQSCVLWLIGAAFVERDVDLFDRLMCMAAHKEMMDVLALLLSDIPTGWQPAKSCRLAAESDCLAALELLLKSCPHDDSFTAETYLAILENTMEPSGEMSSLLLHRMASAGVVPDTKAALDFVARALAIRKVPLAKDMIKILDANAFSVPKDSAVPLLMGACSAGDLQLVELLLAAGAAPGGQEISHERVCLYPRIDASPLHAACASGSEGIERLLVLAGADVNFQGAQGSALHVATYYGLVSTVTSLLNLGADPRLGHSRWCPLVEASRKGHIEIVRLLLEGSRKSSYGQHQLEAAFRECCRGGHSDVAETLLESTTLSEWLPRLWPDVVENVRDETFFNIVFDYVTPDVGLLMQACEKGNAKAIDMMVTGHIHDQYLDQEVSDMFSLAIAACHAPVILTLVEKGASITKIDSHGQSLVRQCFEACFDRCAEWYHTKPQRPAWRDGSYSTDESPSHDSRTQSWRHGRYFAEDDPDAVDRCPSSSDGGRDPSKLHDVVAASGSDAQSLGYGEDGSSYFTDDDSGDDDGDENDSVDHEIDDEIDDPVEGLFSLHTSDPTMVGPSPAEHDTQSNSKEDNSDDKDNTYRAHDAPTEEQGLGAFVGKTPSDASAAIDDQTDIFTKTNAQKHLSKIGPKANALAQILLDGGAELRHESGRFGNVLHMAALLGDDFFVQSAVTKGFDVDLMSGPFHCPASAAIQGGHVAVLEMLLHAGADPQLRLLSGDTLLQNACQCRQPEAVRMLLKHGAHLGVDAQEISRTLHLAITADMTKRARNDPWQWYEDEDPSEAREILPVILALRDPLVIDEEHISAASSNRAVLTRLLEDERSAPLSMDVFLSCLQQAPSNSSWWPTREETDVKRSQLESLWQRVPGGTLSFNLLNAASNCIDLEVLFRHATVEFDLTDQQIESILRRHSRSSKLSNVVATIVASAPQLAARAASILFNKLPRAVDRAVLEALVPLEAPLLVSEQLFQRLCPQPRQGTMEMEKLLKALEDGGVSIVRSQTNADLINKRLPGGTYTDIRLRFEALMHRG